MTELAQYNINLVPEKADKLLLSPVYTDPVFAEDFQFDPNIPEGLTKKMIFMGEDVRPLRAKVGCGFNPSSNPDIAQKSMTTKKVAADKSICADEFRNSLLVLALNTGIDANNPSNTVLRAAAQQTWVSGVQKHIDQLRWFGNEAAPGTGNMNIVNGYWPVYIAAAVNAGATRVSSFSNAPLGSGDGLELMRQVYEGAPLELKGMPASSKVIYVSGVLYDQFLNDIEQGLTNTALYLQRVENGNIVYSYRGVAIRPRYEWDGLALTNLGLQNANLVCYTAKKNLQWASDTASVQYRSWYDEKDEMMNWKTRFQLGFGLAHEELLCVAY